MSWLIVLDQGLKGSEGCASSRQISSIAPAEHVRATSVARSLLQVDGRSIRIRLFHLIRRLGQICYAIRSYLFAANLLEHPRGARAGNERRRLRHHPASCTLHPAPCTLHPAPCTLHPALCTLHPAPCTLHPAPCTLHPAPPRGRSPRARRPRGFW